MNNLLPDLGMSLIFLILGISFANLAPIAHKYTFDHVSFIYAMTNVFSSVFQNQVIGILKGNWSLRRRQRLPLRSTTHPSPSLRITLQLWYNLHLFILWPKGEKALHWAQMIPFLAIHAKGGENMSPKQKDRTTTLILKLMFFNWKISKLVSLCVLKGEQVGFF
jgi:hypothetical protein